jgi:hypothetical protein
MFAGVPSDVFMRALTEQEEAVRSIVRQAGRSALQARLAANAFVDTAGVERRRIISTAQSAAKGHA